MTELSTLYKNMLNRLFVTAAPDRILYKDFQGSVKQIIEEEVLKLELVKNRTEEKNRPTKSTYSKLLFYYFY